MPEFVEPQLRERLRVYALPFPGEPERLDEDEARRSYERRLFSYLHSRFAGLPGECVRCGRGLRLHPFENCIGVLTNDLVSKLRDELDAARALVLTDQAIEHALGQFTMSYAQRGEMRAAIKNARGVKGSLLETCDGCALRLPLSGGFHVGDEDERFPCTEESS